MTEKPKDIIWPFGWIQPYQMSDDYALAVWNQTSGYYELGDGDCYTPTELTRVWHPKWMRWSDVEKAIAAAMPNSEFRRAGTEPSKLNPKAYPASPATIC